MIHYQNPRLVVGTIPVWQDRILLCLRAIEPRAGFWTLPAGFLENGETAAEGAIRETDEEAGARVALGPPFSLLDVVHVHQVHLFYRATLLDTAFGPGPESLEVKLCKESEIPWDNIAFQTISTTLKLFFSDRLNGEFGMHAGSINESRRFVASPPHAAGVPAFVRT